MIVSGCRAGPQQQSKGLFMSQATANDQFMLELINAERAKVGEPWVRKKHEPDDGSG